MQRRWMGRIASVGLVLGLVTVGVVAQRFHAAKRKVSQCCARAEAAAEAAESRARQGFSTVGWGTATAAGFRVASCKGYQDYLARIRTSCRSVLDGEPAEWSPAREHQTFRTSGEFTFSADDMPSPDSAELKKWRTDPCVVRPMPYPYFQALSVTSDCCASHYRDAYYTHTLISRQHGLDLPASFWPFSSSVAAACQGASFTLFAGKSDEPVIVPVRIEGDCVDALPLLLIYYYRGWIDHVHSWSCEAAAGHPLVVPAEKEFSRSEEVTLPLEPTAGFGTTWEGLEISMDVSEEVTAFELTLIDRNGLPHYVVYNRPLDGRQGWDISHLSRRELAKFYLYLDQESNTKYWHAFGGSPPDGVVLQEASLRVKAKKGGRIALTGMRIFDVTRPMIQRQMAIMRQYNVLPIVTTYHGGYSAWCSLHDFQSEGLVKVEAPLRAGGSRTFSWLRPPMGLVPGTPSYISDLQRDFGLLFLLRNGDMAQWRQGPAFAPHKPSNGIPYYVDRTVITTGKPDPRIPLASGRPAHGECLGSDIASFLAEPSHFGGSWLQHTHFNLYNPDVFEPAAPRIMQMAEVKKLHPYMEAGLKLLANTMYNLDQKREFYQRVWTCPISVHMRYKQVGRHLAEHTTIEGSCVRIKPWKDEVSGQTLPDPEYLTQDLHGQTFYVPDPVRARVFVGDTEITALKRNPPDFTGKPSVTVVDTHTPTLVFDEIDFYERNGRVIPDGASYYFQKRNAYSGDYSCEVQIERAGAGRILWNPLFLHSHETGFLRFAYKKTNPKSKVYVGWGPQTQPVFVASESDLRGAQGWQLPYFEDTEYHEVVLDFADMQAPTEGAKTIPRGKVGIFALGLQDASPGDSVFFDRVEFLAARGVRPDCGHGFVIGGQITPRLDGQPVTLEIDGKTRTTATRRGGWYLFIDVPKDSVAEITCEKQGVKYYPARGRLTQVCRNDLEYHIYAVDPRSPSIPRPPGFVGTEVTGEFPPASTGADEEYRNKYDSPSAPHSRRFFAGVGKRKLSYMVEDYVNNFGFIDKDRRIANPDKSIRILLQGECWTEGQQTTTNLHINVLLESLLRRRTGVPVEVPVTATSSSTPASWSLTFEKYGARFNPDFVVLFLNTFNMTHLEPTFLKKAIGWDKEHSPYKMYDFDDQGDLVGFLPDPNYGAFMTPTDMSPVVAGVPLLQSYAALAVKPPLVERSFQLLRAILAEQYLKRMRPKGAVLGLIVGYDKTNMPPYGEPHSPHAVAYDQWLADVRSLCDSLKIRMLDLSPHLLKEDYASLMLWEHDGHLTPTANYKFAEALADQICQTPEFQALVQQRKQAQVAGSPKKTATKRTAKDGSDPAEAGILK